MTTTDRAQDPTSAATLLTLVETDSYVVGNEFYRTDMTITNNTSSAQPVKLYHAADCYLQGSDAGFGFLDTANGTVACTQTPNDSPPQLIEEFSPLTGGNHYFEGGFDNAVFQIPASQQDYPDTCDCNGDPGEPGTAEDNGMGLNWDTTLAPAGSPGDSATFSMISNFSPTGVTSFPIAATGGSTFSGKTGTAVGGTVATFSSADSSDVPGNFTATINWGDGASTAGAIAGSAGSFTVAGTHAYSSSGSFPITVTITRTSNTQNTGTATDSVDHRAAVPRGHGQPRRSTATRKRASRDRSTPPVFRRRPTSSTGWTRATPTQARPGRCTTSRRRTSPLGRTSRATP